MFLFRSDPVPTDYLETEEQEKEKNSMLRCLEMMKLKLGMVGAKSFIVESNNSRKNIKYKESMVKMH